MSETHAIKITFNFVVDGSLSAAQVQEIANSYARESLQMVRESHVFTDAVVLIDSEARTAIYTAGAAELHSPVLKEQHEERAASA